MVNRGYVIGVVSDPHLGIVHRPTLGAFMDWARKVRPDEILLNGDVFDFSQLSDYPKGADALACAIDEIKSSVPILNQMRSFTKRMVILEGNHDRRWYKKIVGPNAQALKGAKGLSLQEQCEAHGLNPSIEWVKETAKTPIHWIAKGVLGSRHGDLQAGRFGGSQNLCNLRLSRNQGVSELVGHHHTAALAFRTAFGLTSFCMTLPTMASPEDYNPGANWQRGFGVITANRDPKIRRTKKNPLVIQPDVVLVNDGVCLWGGKIYGEPT